MTCLERDDNTSLNCNRRRNSTKKEIREKCIICFGCELSPDSLKGKKTKRRNDDMTKRKNTRYEYMLLLGNEHLRLSHSSSSISAFAFFPFTVKFLFCSFFPIFILLVMFMFLAWQNRHYCRINTTCKFSKESQFVLKNLPDFKQIGFGKSIN